MAREQTSLSTGGKIVVGVFVVIGAIGGLVVENVLGYSGMISGMIFGGVGGGAGGLAGAIVAQLAGLTWRSGGR